MAKTEIDPQILRELFLYDPATGELRWAVNPKNGIRKPGDLAGCVDSNGYRMVEVNGRGYGAHVLIFVWMTGKWPKHKIDHWNGITDDNRWVNLREATHSQNKANCRAYRTNKSGAKGVYQDKRTGRFRVVLQVNGKRKGFGFYATFDEARKVAEAAHAETWGAFSPYHLTH